ncbi:alpha/beta hydrolase [Steroidobacter sp. S1-65]|uniref:Alpha/beta hydrolase n=1 Tax=Steroidobacter gossypii TaxID=2805490 RepID=A0ABS1WSI8_9GAMM|nr:alpha/beta hydrolase [Steroidobacter gossypii]MBM0103925.1 alpha/beta hydrolase [Steroidobacter gossypii]
MTHETASDLLPPEWFTRAVNAPCESRYVDAAGAAIHYLSWNRHETDKPGLVLAHGFRAHARWWSFIAPFLTERFRVVALDFGGMGDSGNRDQYTHENYARDLLAVIDDAGFDRPAVVGHSFGGRQVLQMCAAHPECVGRAIVVDSFFHLHDGEPRIRAQELRPKKIYPTYEAARARFRLIPPENRAAGYVINYIAEHSIKRVDDGYTWKFDDTKPRLAVHHNVSGMLARMVTPVSIVYGDASAIVSHEHAAELVALIPNCHGPIAIPESHHHVMLDQPLSLVAALRALLY